METVTARDRWTKFTKCLCQGARLMVGVPDYDIYVQHMGRTHPDRPVMTYAEFFRDRQDARYGSARHSSFRCC